ncbi:MAG: FecR domain-containing protein, partial [Bdellovibrionia bacterium]
MKNNLSRYIILSVLVVFGLPRDMRASTADSIGKVVLLKGEVRQTIGQIQKLLREGDSVEDGGIVKTGATGSLKVFLQDQTLLYLGPNSTLNLDEVRNRKVPNISLVEGQIRAKVMKNIIASAISNHQVKFIIRTKTAAMGVRGTDFEVVYNEANKVTSLVTFEGAVAMIKIDPTQPSSASQTANLVPLLMSERAVVVTEGRFSSANPVLPQVTLPVKISPAQFESLKRSDPNASNRSGPAGTSTAAGTTPTKSFVSPIPPGVDPKSFSSTSTSMEKQVSAALGISVDVTKSQGTAGSNPGGGTAPATGNGFTVAPAPPPEGQYNPKTGSYAPPAGGFLDMKSGLYIPPPPGSSFDPNTGVYNPPAAMGKFDSTSGSYVPPKDFQLDAKQGLIPMAPASEVSVANGARSPASAAAQPGVSAPRTGTAA